MKPKLQSVFRCRKLPVVSGDLLVVELNGRLICKDQSPQWFVALNDQDGCKAVNLMPFNTPTSAHRAVKLKASAFEWR